MDVLVLDLSVRTLPVFLYYLPRYSDPTIALDVANERIASIEVIEMMLELLSVEYDFMKIDEVVMTEESLKFSEYFDLLKDPVLAVCAARAAIDLKILELIGILIALIELHRESQQEVHSQMTLGDLVSVFYEEFLTLYSDPERAATEAAATLKALMTEVPPEDPVSDEVLK